MRLKHLYLAAALCALTALFSGIMLIRDLTQASAERSANEALARQRIQSLASAPASTEASDPPDPPEAREADPSPPAPVYAPSGRLLAYDGLYEQNQDLAGWLILEDLGVDLPVMYTPEDPERYLHRGFDGQYAAGGCLFLGEGWDPEGNFAIVYGHNMRNGTMFGALDRYRDPAYAKEHPAFRFDTLSEERTYTVLGAFYSRVYNEADREDAFRYYQYTSLEDPAVFQEFLEKFRTEAIYDTGVEVDENSQILVLSTCSYHRRDGRFVVVACRESEELGVRR